jgi:NTE family protein
MRVGLVLGGGGYRGGAWTVGVLQALQSEYNWTADKASLVVGTSAGAMIGALTAAGVPLKRIASGDVFASSAGVKDAGQDLAEASAPRRRHGIPWPTPGSLGLTWNCLRNPGRYPLTVMLSGLLPNGPFSTDPLGEVIERHTSGSWPRQPSLGVVACDYGTGRRIVFGRRQAPSVPLGLAVAASCAVPGYYRPVPFDGHSYIDGGVCSPSNLDVVRHRRLDLVICINPTSAADGVRLTGVSQRAMLLLRDASARILRREAAAVNAVGTEVVMIEPEADEIELMGLNLMRSNELVAIVAGSTELFRKRLRKRRLASTLDLLAGASMPNAA